MELRNEKFQIISDVKINPHLDQFDIVLNTEKINTDDFYMVRAFQIIRNDGRSIKVALIDHILASCIPYAVLDGNYLTAILFSAIVRIDVETGSIIQYVKCDNMGGLLEIHPIDEGYLIRGEGDIFRYDCSLNRVWHFIGRDILVSLYCDKHFWIEDKVIHCRDFLGWHYVLDWYGKLLRDFKEFGDIKT